MKSIFLPNLTPSSLDELERIEVQTSSLISRFPLDGILLTLRQLYRRCTSGEDYPQPFMIASAVRFALLNCETNQELAGQTDLEATRQIIHYATAYALADPVGWLKTASSSTLAIMMRHVGNQHPYFVAGGKWARAHICFNEIPGELETRRSVPRFPFHERFEQLVGTNLTDFITVCYVAFSAALSSNHLGFARDYFDVARKEGMAVPADNVIVRVLHHIAGTPQQHRAVLSTTRQADRNYGAYDYNSLMVYPLIRPWAGSGSFEGADDRMLAPIPEMLFYRMFSGIYYHMRQTYGGDFEQWFGAVLEVYVGKHLREVTSNIGIISEEEIRRTYPSTVGKAPDWAVIVGNTAILFECKSSRLHRVVYAQGREDDIRKSLRDVASAAIQLQEFKTAILNRAPGLERFAGCDEVLSVITTLEQIYLSSSADFRDLLKEILPPECESLNPVLLSLDDLEFLQTWVTDGIMLVDFIRRLGRQQFQTVLESYQRISPRTFHDSLLGAKEAELSLALGVPS